MCGCVGHLNIIRGGAPKKLHRNNMFPPTPPFPPSSPGGLEALAVRGSRFPRFGFEGGMTDKDAVLRVGLLFRLSVTPRRIM